jgi:regulator of cell morphogenesis and NO signaling
MTQQYKMNNNLPFTPKIKLADVIHLDYRLIPIIGRFGIEYGLVINRLKKYVMTMV